MTVRPYRGLSPSRNQHRSDSNLAVERNSGAHPADPDVNAGLLHLNQGVPVELNECVEIALSPSISFYGNVVWVNGSNCGIAFESRRNVPLSASAFTDEQETEQKARLQMACPFCGDAHVGSASVAPDAAQRETQGRHDGVFVRGLHVKVLLGGNQERCAVVRWSRNNIAELFLP